MKKISNYIFKLLKVLLWPVLFGIGQIFIVLPFSSYYNNKIYNNILEKNPENYEQVYENFVKSDKYAVDLNNYINDNLIYIILITVLIFLPLFLYKYKKYKIKCKKSNLRQISSLIIPSISLAILLNIIIINFNKLVSIENVYNDNKYIIFMIISSGIIGPLLEEFLFRGIVYNELKKFNSEKRAMWISIIIFALFHQSISQIIYAFIFGYIFTKIYVKTNNIVFSTIFHILSNTVVTIFINGLISMNFYLSIFFIVMFSINFYFSYKFMYKKI